MKDLGGDAVGCFPGELENWEFGRVSSVWGRWMIGEPKGGEDWIWWKCELFGDRGLGCLVLESRGHYVEETVYSEGPGMAKE